MIICTFASNFTIGKVLAFLLWQATIGRAGISTSAQVGKDTSPVWGGGTIGWKELLEMLLEEFEAEENKQTSEKEEPRELIKGISGLAEFLACGTTKAQSIMNSGILQDRNIAISRITTGGT